MSDYKLYKSILNILNRSIKHEYVLVIGSEVLRENGNHDEIVNNFINQNATYSTTNKHAKVRSLFNPEEETPGLENFKSDKLNCQLKNLLETGWFRVVLTTTFDPLLENALREIWSNRCEKLKVFNIYADTTDEIDTTDKFDLPEVPLPDETIEPTLYYVFGSGHCEDNLTFVLDDNDRIDVITRWLTNAPKNLQNYINGNDFSPRKKILAIGCKLDDWLFRFFWYAITGDKSSSANGSVAITLNCDDKEEKRLYNYLRDALQYVNNNASRFMKAINDLLVPDSNDDTILNQFRLTENEVANIFLSYRSESYRDARRLFLLLRSAGYNVWFDKKRLEGGDVYRRKIITAMDRSDIIITLIDGELLEAREKAREAEEKRFYYDTEWKHANELTKNGRHFILPITLHGCKEDRRINNLPDYIECKHMLDADAEYSQICQKINEIIKNPKKQ